MLTVLAKNRHNEENRATIVLPAQEGQLRAFRELLGAESDREISIQYAGTGRLWYTDTILLENNLKGNPITIDELNLFAYQLSRMDENIIKKYDDTMSGYTDDLTVAGIKSLVNEAYDTIAQAAGHDESPLYYDGENIDECLAANAELKSRDPATEQTEYGGMTITL